MYDITLDDNRKDDHLILSSLQSDGAIRVVCGSLTLTPFYENNGNLFYLNLLASEDVSGDFDILVKNIYISEPNGTRYDLDDISAKITIPAYTQGDVNDDGLIAIDDVVMSINYILGNNSTNFVFKAGDINSDNRILIDDVVLLVNKILGINTNKALASRQYPDYETVTFSGTDKIYMNLSNVDDYSAMQFDLILPKNTNINDICLNSSSNHTIAYRYVGNELVRVVVTSLTNDSFSENSQFCINVNTTSNSNILLTNAYASSPRGKLVKISDSTALIAGTTDIEGITSTSNPVDIYDMSGRLVKKNTISTDGLHKGVYFMNGKKIIIE